MIEAGHHPFFIQKLKVSSELKGIDRRKVFATLCEGRRVLHMGCADSPITDVHNNLHIELQNFAQALDGFDLDEKSLDILRPHIRNGRLYSNLEQITGEYDVVLVPEVIEHVDNVKLFLEQLDKLKFRDLVITAPDAFSCMHRHFEYNQPASEFVEIVHPDHNVWYTPYTLYNTLKKYTTWDVNNLYFLGDISVMAICSKNRVKPAGCEMDRNQWQSGIDNEVFFWSKWLEGKGLSWPADYEFRTNPDAELQPHLAVYLKNLKHAPKILDVGAGPMTILGKKMNGRSLDITAVDALAERYNYLTFPSGLPLIRTQQCESESLSSEFSSCTFDLAYARNTLDHSFDPIAAIKEMIKVTKPGGLIITEHAANEAITENWKGFHQWNFHVEGRDLKISNRNKTFSVLQEIEGLATIVKIVPDGSPWIECVMQKL